MYVIGVANIENDELQISSYVEQQLKQSPNLVLLGRQSANGHHLPIFSFLVKFQKRFLHYNFVSALLNDLFGIQSRGIEFV